MHFVSVMLLNESGQSISMYCVYNNEGRCINSPLDKEKNMYMKGMYVY